MNSRHIALIGSCIFAVYLWGCSEEPEDPGANTPQQDDVGVDAGEQDGGDEVGVDDVGQDADTDPAEVLATVTTGEVTAITTEGAQVAGEVVDEGSDPVTTRGVCWSSSEQPTTDDDPCRLVGQGPGSFSAQLHDLSPGTDYNVRAFATNLAGTAYGQVQSFTTSTDEQQTLPTVVTNPVTSVSTDSAQGAGEVVADGNAEVTERGLCWSTSAQPTTSDTCDTAGGGLGDFTFTLTGLEPDTTYYVRAYATNSQGTAYGDAVDFHTHAGVVSCGTVTDSDGTTYETVEIGSQCWMAENLRTSTYRDGSPIANITEDAAWGSTTSGAWAYYDNDAANAEPFGMMYNWYAVDDPRGLCPDGWRVPSDNDWKTLELTLGMSQSEVDATGHRGDATTNPGGALKSTGTEYWLEPNEGATNTTGFSAYPGGDRNPGPDEPGFWSLGYSSYMWSSTDVSDENAWIRGLSYAQPTIFRSTPEKRFGFSVRCVQ